MAGVLEALGQRDHLGDVLGRPREDVGRQDVHERGVGMERRLVRGRDLGRRLRFQAGRHEHPVLAAVEALVPQVPHVRDVLDVEDVEAVVEERPPDQVREEVAAQVADVGVAVDGRAAAVHRHPARLDRVHGLDLAGERVPEAQGHGIRPLGSRQGRSMLQGRAWIAVNGAAQDRPYTPGHVGLGLPRDATCPVRAPPTAVPVDVAGPRARARHRRDDRGPRQPDDDAGPGGGQRDRQHPVRRSHDVRPGRPERRGHGRGHGPDLREPHRVRREPRPAPGPCGFVGRARWGDAGRLPPPARPGVLRRHPDHRRGCRPKLAADRGSGTSVAARLAHGRCRGGQRLPARDDDRSVDRGRQGLRRGRRGPPDPSGEPVPGHRREPDVRDHPDRHAGRQGRERRLRPRLQVGQRGPAPREHPLLGRDAGDRHGPPRDVAQWRQPARGVREQGHRLHVAQRLRRGMDRLRPRPGPVAPLGALAVAPVPRLRRPPEAVRRRPRPPGLRAGRRLGAHREPRRPGHVRPGHEHGPAGDPGSVRPRLQPARRHGPGQVAPRGGRLSGWDGLPDRDVRLGWDGRRRRHPAPAQGRARHHDQVRDDGLRGLLRPPGDRSAGDVVARLGGGLPRPERLPGRAARDRASRTTTATGARPSSMPRSPRPAPRPTPRRSSPPTRRPRPWSSATRRSSRSPTGRAGRSPGRASWAHPTTAWASSAWPASRGRREPPRGRRRRLVVACAASAIVLSTVGVQLAAAAGVMFGTASASSTFGKSARVQASRSRSVRPP